MPRLQSVKLLSEKGDYLVRINELGKIVLSIVWTDPINPNKLKDGHYIIDQGDNVKLQSLFSDYLLCIIRCSIFIQMMVNVVLVNQQFQN